MRSEAEVQPSHDRGEVWSPIRAIAGFSGIYLFRLFLGFVVWVILTIVVFNLAGRAHPEAEIVGELPSWTFVVIPLLPALVIASVTYLPLWTNLEKDCFRGRVETIAATRNLLIPAVGLQLWAVLGGGLGPGVANFLVSVGVCFLVTLALDFDRRSQFVLLLIGGAQAIVVCLVVVTLNPMGPTGQWQVKVAVWLGAVPSIVLMVVLWKQSRKALSERSSVAPEAGRRRGAAQ